jgi:hypothetical protein
MTNGTWIFAFVDAASHVWYTANSTNFSLTSTGSTIKITSAGNGIQTFTGGGLTFNNIWWARGASTGNNVMTSSGTFTDFKDDGSEAHSILFTAGTTTTVSTFTVSGTAGKLITINSNTTGTHTLNKLNGGTITCNYLNIQHSIATPDLTWLALNSTNNQSDATAGYHWYFDYLPNPAFLLNFI